MEIQKLIKRLEVEIDKTPTGDLRNLLCDVNIMLHQQALNQPVVSNNKDAEKARMGEIMEALAQKGISTSMKYDEEKDQCYVDLETHAKSHLYLYGDGMLRGRYDYETQIDLTQDIEVLITELCHEFNNALYGRNYCQEAWAELCRSKNIKLQMYGM